MVDYFSSEGLRHDLKGKTVRGGMWTAAAQGLIMAIQFAAIPVLARLLDSTDFGLVAMVTVFTGFSAMFVDSGLSMATVQRDKITHQQVSNLFWVAAGLGLAVSLVMLAAAPAIAWLYDEPRLVSIGMALAVAPLFAGLMIQHQALLRRTMQMRRLVTVQVVSTLLSYGVAIAVAGVYRSYWALVVMTISASALRTVGTWMACRWWPSFPRRGAGVRAMVGFGANLTGFSIVNYLSRNVDYLLIGWYWGPTLLGFYERAYKLFLFPMRQINGPLSIVAIPSLSRVVDEPQQYRRGYLTFLESILVLTVPLAAFAIVTADLCIHILLGPQWDATVPIFTWLALAAVVHPMSNTTGWLFMSQGRGNEFFRWGIVGASLCIASFLVGLPWGPTYVAAAYSISGLLIRVPLVLWWATRKGPVRLSDIGTCLPLPIVLGGSVFVIVSLLRQVLGELGALAEFLACLAAALLTVSIVLLATRQGQRWLDIYRKLFVEYRFKQKQA